MGASAGAGSRSATAPVAIELVLLVAILGALVIYVAPTLGRPLLEKHAFRQTQTAFPARTYHDEGIDLLRPSVPVLGEPFTIPFEFPLFQAMASGLMDIGVRDDPAMRLTGLLCFLATALFLYMLVRHVAGAVAAIGALACLTFTPFALAWSRASMIEYLATAGAVGFTWSFLRWREERRAVHGAIALVTGLVGMLVKPTTAIFWVAPALAYRVTPHRAASSTSTRPFGARTLILVLVPILAAVLWTWHADSVKAANPATAWLTSGALREWNLGSLTQRFDPNTWGVIIGRAVLVLGSYVVLVPAAVIAVAHSRQRRFWLAVASAVLLPPLVFTNLYVAHDYYLAAVTPAVAAILGLGIAEVWVRVPKRALVLGVVLPALALLPLATLEAGRSYWLSPGGDDDAEALLLAEEIAAHTEPDDLVAIVGLDWSPAVLYYAHRRGHMIVDANEEFAFDLIHDQRYQHLLVADPPSVDLGPLQRWAWVGALAPHLYVLGDSESAVSRSMFSVSSASPPTSSDAGRSHLRRPLLVPCNQAARLPTRGHSVWIRLSHIEPGTLLSISPGLAPLPARRTVFAARAIAVDGDVTLSCSGADSVVVDAVVSAG